VLTAAGLTKFNMTDVGLTGALKELFVKQDAPAAAAGPVAPPAQKQLH